MASNSNTNPTTDRPPGDPTPEEIAERCERIRAAWSREEHLRRAAGRVDLRTASQARQWTPPVIETTPDVAAAVEVR